METLKDRMAQLVENHKMSFIDYRRQIHQNPELSFQEKRTSEYIKKVLSERGIKIVPISGHYSFIAVIDGTGRGKTVGIRAELDALPIKEETNVKFSSVNKGVMHACGHDVHMASVIGAGIILNDLRDHLHGRVLLVFESGEEVLPGGAKSIIESVEFKGIVPDVMLGVHVLPELEVGQVGFCPGRYMASGDEIHLTVKGKGGHAALPHTLIDPVIIASNIILTLQTVISRSAPALVPSVLSFGRVEAMGATNVIPSEVKIAGTFRTMDETWRQKAHLLIDNSAKGIARAAGGDCDVEIKNGYPSVFNNIELTDKFKLLAVDLMGVDNVVEIEPRMTTDDFAFFSQNIPSVFFRVGIRPGKSSPTQLHSANFLADEKAIEKAVSILSWLAIKELSAR